MDSSNARVGGKQLAASVVFIVLVLLFRKPDGLLCPQLWAEDGTVFLVEAEIRGIAALTTPYAGYLHMIPRLVALAGHFINYLYVPHFYNYCSLLILLSCAVFILRCRLDLPHRSLMAILLVVLPPGWEVLLNITNVQWILATVLPLLILQPPAEKVRVAVWELIVLILIGLTGPFIIVFSPLLIYRWLVYRKSAGNALFVMAGFLAAGIQISFVMSSHLPQATRPGVPNLEQWLTALANFSKGFLLGNSLSSRLPVGVCVVFLTLLLISLLYCTCRLYAKDRQDFRLCLSLAYCAAIAYAAGLYRCHLNWNITHLTAFGWSARYVYIPYVLMSWMLVLFLRYSGSIKAIGQIGLLLVALSAASGFPIHPLMNLEWRHYAKRVNSGETVVVPINPFCWVSLAPRHK